MGWLCSGWSFRRGLNQSEGAELRKRAALYLLPWILSSCKVTLPHLPPVVQPQNRLSWGKKGRERKKKKKRKKKGCFSYGLVSWTASLRQCQVPEQVERRKKCHPKWRSGKQNSWQQQAFRLAHFFCLFLFFASPPTRWLPSLLYHILSHLNLSFCPLPHLQSHSLTFSAFLLVPVADTCQSRNLIPPAKGGLALVAEEITENGRCFWQAHYSSCTSKVFLCCDLEFPE